MKIEIEKEIEKIFNKKDYMDIFREKSYILLNNSIKSDVVRTLISDCSLKCLSLDQTGTLNSNASAKNGTSVLCDINLPAFSFDDSSGSWKLMILGSKEILDENSLKDIFALRQIASEYFDNSFSREIGANSSKLNVFINSLVNDLGLNNEKIIFVSTTNFIFNQEDLSMSFFNFLPNSIQSSSVNSEFSSPFSNCSNASSCLIRLVNASLANSDQFNQENFSIFFLNSSGIDSVMFAILSHDIFSSHNTNDFCVFKSFDELSESEENQNENSETFEGIFSSDNNLISLSEKNITLFSNDFRSVHQNRKNCLLCELGKIIFENFVNRNSCSEQFQTLPNHNSCSFENRHPSVNLTVNHNVIINFSFHNKLNKKDYINLLDEKIENSKGKLNKKKVFVSGEHLVYSSSRMLSNCLGERTFALEFSNPLSPEKIGHLPAIDNAIYKASFSCGDILFACSKNSMNSPEGINANCPIKNLYASSNSSFESFVNLSIFDSCFLTSSDKNSGAINLNLCNFEFNSNTLEVTPLFINEDMITLASTTNLSDIFYFNALYLFDNELFISLANSSASACVNLLLETICLNLSALDNFSLMNSVNKIDNSILDIPNSDFKSSGILIHISSINKLNKKDYINLPYQIIKEDLQNEKNT